MPTPPSAPNLLARRRRKTRLAWLVLPLVSLCALTFSLLRSWLWPAAFDPRRCFVSTSADLRPKLCLLQNGDILISIPGVRGSDLFLYERRTLQGRRLRHVGYIETSPALSPNGRTLAYVYDDLSRYTSGIETIDLATGRTRQFPQRRFAGCDSPVFSPGETHVLFAHCGTGLNAPLLAVSYPLLSELDLTTGQTRDIDTDRFCPERDLPVYLDESHLLFCGRDGETPQDAAEFEQYDRRHDTAVPLRLPGEEQVGLIGRFADRRNFLAVRKSARRGATLAVIDQDDLGQPKNGTFCRHA